MTTEAKPSPRERLLEAAATLTYRDGVGIGIEALCKAAGVSKRSMYQLFTSKADGTAPQQLTHFADSDAVWAAWSPSGNRIAFERDVYTGVRVTRAAIYTMNADGSGLRSLTPTGLNGRPSWSRMSRAPWNFVTAVPL